jgi:molecular chaperone HscB
MSPAVVLMATSLRRTIVQHTIAQLLSKRINFSHYFCSMNYFELFEIPVAPTIDKTGLSRKYFELQKKFHPDFFTNESEEEKESVLQQSADINKGFKIFQNKEKTIEYFLQQKGIIATDEKYALPPDFLMEMMELNEELDEADPELTLGKVKEYETDLYTGIEQLLANYNDGATTASDFEKLKAYYYKKKYLERILDRLAD